MFHAAELFGQNVRLFLTEPRRSPPACTARAGSRPRDPGPVPLDPAAPGPAPLDPAAVRLSTSRP